MKYYYFILNFLSFLLFFFFNFFYFFVWIESDFRSKNLDIRGYPETGYPKSYGSDQIEILNIRRELTESRISAPIPNRQSQPGRPLLPIINFRWCIYHVWYSRYSLHSTLLKYIFLLFPSFCFQKEVWSVSSTHVPLLIVLLPHSLLC